MATLTADSGESAINIVMKNQTVLGIQAPRPRLTTLGLAIIAFALALPVGLVLWLIEWLWL